MEPQFSIPDQQAEQHERAEHQARRIDVGTDFSHLHTSRLTERPLVGATSIKTHEDAAVKRHTWDQSDLFRQKTLARLCAQ